jgi:hypothetical protein
VDAKGTLQRTGKSFKRAKLPSKFCFFIDGLDEYEGDEEDIIRLLQSLATSPNVKICVSSRPWNAFIDAFRNCSWKLVLEDLTKDDLRKYVHDMLIQDKAFAKVSKHDSRCQTLIPQIADKAQGVWLWVYLVVRDLVRDLKGKEEFPLLQRRLDSFPEELEAYFANIIERIDKIHQEETAKIFLIAVEAISTFPALGLKYLIMEKADPSYALKMPIQQVFREQAWENAQKWEMLLNSRCRDLLELSFRSTNYAPPIIHYKVEFLHRTVRDFLRNNYQGELQKQLGDAFDARSSLSKIILALIKGYPVPQEGNGFDFRHKFERDMLGMVDELVYYAREMERNGKASLDLLDELDHTLNCLNDDIRRLCKHQGHWTNMEHGYTRSKRYYKSFLEEEGGNYTFLALAVQKGLRLYVDRKLDECPELLLEKKGRPLLDYVLRPSRKLSGKIFSESEPGFHTEEKKDAIVDFEMLGSLLSHGSDPNENFKGSVPEGDQAAIWGAFLSYIYRRRDIEAKLHFTLDERQRTSWYEACKMLIEHGADLETYIRLTEATRSTAWPLPKGSRISSLSVLREVFGAANADRLVSKKVEEPENFQPKQNQPSIFRRILGWK